ncbi:MAG: diguanylate cyclase [Phycisphaerales bacterium JB059]
MTPVAHMQDDSTPVVLVIDDCEDVHRLLTARLRNEALELVCETDGKIGIERAHQIQPSLIVLDLDMPVLDGFAVLRRLKEAPETADIPVIVLSGMQSPNDKVTAFDLGAVDYVTKPFDLMELRVRLRSALRMRRLIHMLAQRAQIDGLTGLWNRAHFEDRWTEETKRAQRSGRPLSLAIFDLDHFKQVNDTYGHPVGDAVLQGFASVLQQSGRQADTACRYGGEEFVVIMPDTTPDQATILCDRVRDTLANAEWPGKPSRTITVSIGVAGSEGATPTGRDEWIEIADRNLYRSKTEGRDRVTVTRLPGDPPRLAEAG